MQPTVPFSCWQCGTVLSLPGGRCPICGAEQPSPEPRSSPESQPFSSPRVRPSRPIPKAGKAARDKAIPWVVLGVGLAAILLFGVAIAPHRRDDVTAAVPSVSLPATTSPLERLADPNDLRIEDPSKVDPSDVLVRAKSRALVWHRDAVLVSMRAQPMSDGKVNLTSGGTIEYVFGKPTDASFGMGVRVSGKRFRITLAGSESTAVQVGGTAGRAALEPNCPIEEAARKAQAAGLPASAPVSAVYEMSDKHRKPVWRVTAMGENTEARTVDGQTCAILVR
jgi:hypothetical protein